MRNGTRGRVPQPHPPHLARRGRVGRLATEQGCHSQGSNAVNASPIISRPSRNIIALSAQSFAGQVKRAY